MSPEQIEVMMRLRGANEYTRDMQKATVATTEYGTAAQTAGTQAKKGAVGVDAMAASAKKGVGSLEKMKKVGTNMRSTGRKLTTGLTLPILAVAAGIGKLSIDFDRSMRNVNSIAQLPEQQFERLKQQVLAMAGPTAQAPKTLADGLYDLVSSGFSASEAIGVLKASAYAASAGLTTTETSTQAIAAALNSYHLPASKAQEVSDILFETVNKGVISFSELASQLGYIVSTGNAAGIGLKELGAEVSTLTLAGQVNGQAITNLNQAITSFLKPSKEMKAAVKELGYENAETLLKTKGFQGALELLAKQAGGSKEQLSAYFGNVRAARAAFALTGKGAIVAKENLKAFNDVSGSTKTVLKEQEKSVGFQLQRAWAKLQAVLIQVGEDILPAIIPLVLDLAHGISSMAHWFSNLSPTTQKFILIGVGILAVLGPMVYIIGSLTLAITALIPVVAALFSPITAIVIGVAAAAAGFIYLYNNVEWFHDAVDAVVGFIKANWRTLLPILLAPFFPLIAVIVAVVTHLDWFKNAFNNVVNFFRALPGRIVSGIRKLPRMFGQILAKAVILWATLPIRIAKLQWKLLTTVVSITLQIGPKLFSAAVSIIGRMLAGLKNGWVAVMNWIHGLPGEIASAIASLAGKLFDLGVQIASEIAKGFMETIKGTPVLGEAVEAGEWVGGAAEDVGGWIAGGGPFGAEGINFVQGGPTLVGEHGPEILNLPRGGELIGASRSRREMATGGATVRPLRASPGPTPIKLQSRRQNGAYKRTIRHEVPVKVELKLGRRKFGEAMALAMLDEEINE